jgi:peroxiredoxin
MSIRSGGKVLLSHLLLPTLVLAIAPVGPLSAEVPQEKPVADKATDIHPLGVGNQVPDGSLRDLTGKTVHFSDLIHRKPTVVIFYRGGWCPYCNLQMEQLMKLEPRLLGLGYQILAISADKPEKMGESLEKHKLNYTLLSDSKLELARSFGLVYQVDPKTLEKMKAFHVDLEAASGETHHRLPVPAAYVVDSKGHIRFSYFNPDIRVRVDPDKLFEAAESALKR